MPISTQQRIQYARDDIDSNPQGLADATWYPCVPDPDTGIFLTLDSASTESGLPMLWLSSSSLISFTWGKGIREDFAMDMACLPTCRLWLCVIATEI